jgi:hypothetical protein
MKRYLILLALVALSISLRAQQKDTTKKQSSTDSLLNSMSSDDKQDHTINAFKGTRLIFGQTAVTVKKNNLNFMVLHRFGDIGGDNGGGKTAFGLDAVQDVYIGFEYGVSDNFNIDLGRNTVGQLIEGGLKWAVLHQTSGGGSPVAITLVGDFGVRPYQGQQYPDFSSRVSYLAQAVFASRLSPDFSVQVSPVYISNNSPQPALNGVEQQFVTLEAAMKYKVSKHMGIIVDYAHPFSSFRTGANGFSDPFGAGIEVETGGHVFTLNVSNARAISEINSFSASQSDYGRGQYRLGFTISRMFDFNHHKKDSSKY